MKMAGRKLIVNLVLFTLLVALAIPGVFAFSGGGSGTSGDPYEIDTCSELQEMNDAKTAYYELIGNVDCSATTGWNGGAGFIPVGTIVSPFSGYLNGHGYNITDLFINTNGVEGTGLFGAYDLDYPTMDTLTNFTLVDPVIIANMWGTGALVGWYRDNVCQGDCWDDPGISHIGIINPDITGFYGVGGLAGQIETFTTIDQCYTQGGTVE
jgi:hypothetical protein